MHARGLLLGSAVALLLPAVALPAQARGRSTREQDAAPSGKTAAAPEARAVLGTFGMTLGPSGSERDTLGLLVSDVMADGPAERDGIDAGNRVAELNGVSLRLDPEEIGRAAAQDGVQRRLARALRDVRPGDTLSLRVWAAGRYRTVSLQSPGGRLQSTAPVAAGDSAVDAAPTLAGVIADLGRLQSQLRQLAQDEEGTVSPDTLTEAARQLGELRRRLRAAQGTATRGSRAERDANAIPGLEVSAVADAMVPYFGAGSERGLLVLDADASWAPLQAGDVVLSVDDEDVTLDRLRAASGARGPVTLEVLRRKRTIEVTVHER